MRTPIRGALAALGLAGLTLPLVAGLGQAAEPPAQHGYPSTQNPLQAATAVQGTLTNAAESLGDGLNGDDRPDGANGTESEFFPVDPRLVEGPVGGLLHNGPFR